MRGLVLGVGCFLAILGLSSLGLQLRQWGREYRLLLSLFGGSVAAYGALFHFLPADLGFISAGVREPSAAVDFCNGLLLLAMLFHGFWVYVYATGLGPSSTILIELDRAGPLERSRLEGMHAQSGPLDSILARRLPKLLESGYVKEEDGGYRLQPPARKYALVVLWLHRIFHVER